MSPGDGRATVWEIACAFWQRICFREGEITIVRLLVAVWLAALLAPSVALLAALPGAASAAAETAQSSPSNRLIVRFSDPAWPDASERLNQSGAFSVRSAGLLSGTYLATFPDAAAASEALSSLEGDVTVAWAEFDGGSFYALEPDDPLFTDQVWAQSIDLPAAWNITGASDTTVVAVVDSGVSTSHPDLAGKVLDGYDFLNNDATTEDDVGHGTAVAGIIAARGNDGIGIAGVAMNAPILPVKVGSLNGAPVSALAAGIIWAADHGAAVINVSLVAGQPSMALRDAVQYAYDHNVPVVTAAGNEPEAVTYPGLYETSISVGASTFWGTLATFSSRANRVDIIAPGTSVLAPWWSSAEGNDWTTVSGTSFAAPMVTGVVAMLKSLNPEMSVEDVRNVIGSTALPVGDNSLQPGVGAGQLDAGVAVRALLSRHFDDTWFPVDQPVVINLVDRSWIWGPGPIATGFEEYTESESGQRLVRYYDKSRMEVNHPNGDRSDRWYVTNGLLVMELISGRMQIGDTDTVYRGPAEITIAGDANDPLAPTYADFLGLLDQPPAEAGAVITTTVNGRGIVGADDRYTSYGITAAQYVAETDHQIASVFWDYLNTQGLVMYDGQISYGPLFDPTFFATGLPITEAYWTQALVAGVRQDVLVQCFERRCLTFTPGNAPEWRVEMGNVGQHYYRWRYRGTSTSMLPREIAF